jgi:hypothetical protein
MTQHFTDLSDLDQLLAGAKPAERKPSDPVPNGRYQVFVHKAHVDEHPDTKTRQLTWELVIIAGKCRGRRLWHKNQLATPKNIEWLLHDLQLVGVALPERMNDLHTLTPQLLDAVLDVSVTNQMVDGKNFTNIYLNRRLALEVPADLRNTTEESGHDFHATF